MAISLGELVVPLKLDGANFKSGVTDAGSQLVNFAKKAISIAAVTAAVVAVGKAMKGAFDATQKWADEMDSLQDVTGVSNKTAAALAATVRKSGVDIGKLTGGLTILNKGLVDSKGKLDVTGKTLKDWGVNVLDANGKLRDQESILKDVANRYGEFSTQQEKVNFLTEVFGKSGADLVDFFDTLAQDGGIDAVSSKMEKLGLAINPERYVQFNKNLEELKLIGLSMAVAFTEKAMPALEKFLDVIVDFAQNPDLGKLVGKLDNFVAIIFKQMGDSINNWVAGGGAQELSDSIIAWIDTIGTSDAVKSKTAIAAEHLLKAIADAFMAIDWTRIDGALDRLDARVTEWINVWSTELDAKIVASLTEINESFNKWALDTWNTIKQWGRDLLASIRETATRLEETLETKLREIGKKFFTRAAGWVQQAVQGFTGQLPELLSVVSGLVASINAELKRIITSFRLSISVGSVLGVSDTASLGTGSTGGSTGGGHHGKSEVIPVTQMATTNAAPTVSVVELSDRSINRIIEGLGLVIPTQTVKALNSR